MFSITVLKLNFFDYLRCKFYAMLYVIFFSGYTNTAPRRLLEVFDQFFDHTNESFIDIMNSWIYESGYPIVTVSLTEDENVAQINQVCRYSNSYVTRPGNDY